MVSLAAVKASNALVAKTLPELVVVIVGGTSGIGEYTLKEFARSVPRPRLYNVGRSQEASDRIAAECKKLNSEVEYTFIKKDTSLMRNVDDVCRQIKAKEHAINVLILSTGTFIAGVKTDEGLHLVASLAHHSRTRFILNLLPLLEAATGIRRVISIFCGTKEGAINMSNIQGWDVKAKDFIKHRGHMGSIITLIHTHFAQQSPTVSFIHDFPGPVRSGIARGTTGLVFGIIKLMGKILGPFMYIPDIESGERHLYAATSAQFPPKEGKENGVPLSEGQVAQGIDGLVGSGNYTTDETNEAGGAAVVELLTQFKKDGMVEKIWKVTQDEYDRIDALPISKDTL